MRLLLIDDDPVVHEVLTSALRPLGIELLRADSLDTARDILRAQSQGKQPIDRILVDLFVGEANGSDILQWEDLASYPRKSIVFMSARPSEEVRESQPELAEFAYLEKPFSFAQLRALLFDTDALN